MHAKFQVNHFIRILRMLRKKLLGEKCKKWEKNVEKY